MTYYDELDDKLFDLQKVCNRYKNIDCFADWVLFAIERHITTNRATREFERSFLKLNDSQLLEIVKYCLNKDKDNDAIVKNFTYKMENLTIE